MPIEYHILHSRKLVAARGVGEFTQADVFGYQREVWSRPDVAGYDELLDMTAVERIAPPTPARMAELAALSASMDAPLVATKFAIVAPQDVAFGLGRMFEAYREMAQGSKQVGVFRTLAAAKAFLGLDAAADLSADA